MMANNQTEKGRGSDGAKVFSPKPMVVINGAKGLFLETVIDEVEARGWRLLDLATSYGNFPKGPLPAGALINVNPETESQELERQLVSLGIPVIRFNSDPDIPTKNVIPHIAHDSLAAARLAVDHFAERNYTSVGCVSGAIQGGLRETYDEFSKRATELGLTYNEFTFETIADEGSKGRLDRRTKAFAKWVSTCPRPIGILTYSRAAASLCTFCDIAAIRVPEEVAILSNKYVRSLCAVAPVPLSGVEFSDRKLAQETVKLLQQKIDGELNDEETLLISPKGIVVDRSTDILAVDDPLVASALSFMRDHFHEPIEVDDITRYLSVSRRTLERAFRQSLGRGINVELRRKRLDVAKELLSSTESTIADIAHAVGFGSVNYLHRAFRKHFGMSPRQFRLQLPR